MSKVSAKSLAVVILCLIVFLWLLGSPVYAIECSQRGVTYSPNTFTLGQPIQLNFEIDPDKLNNLKNNLNITHIKVSLKRLLSTGYDVVQTIDSLVDGKFSIDVNDQHLQKETRHTGNLYMSSDGNNWSDLCGEISYTVVKAKCTITQAPSTIPPGSSFNVNFSAIPNISYNILYDSKSSNTGYTQLTDPSTGKAILVTTDLSGQGTFSNITIPGSDGEKRIIMISGGNTGSCATTIQIDATISQPIDVANPTNPFVTTLTQYQACDPKKDPKCTSGGGKIVEDCTNDKNNPGIATAIGCIHTNPVAFTKDLLKFAVAIGGGLAFLMMLLGAFQMVTSAGNPETLAAGKDRLTSAVIGLLFIIFAVLLLQIIGFSILSIPEFGP